MNRLQLAALKPYFLSHHPSCEHYASHTITLHGQKLCIGCFIGLPSAFIAILLLALTYAYSPKNNLNLLIIGILFLIPYGVNIALADRKVLKIVSKIALGFSSAFFIGVILTSSLTGSGKILWAIIFFNVFLGILGGKRLFELYKTCKQCSFHSDFQHCPGFGPLIHAFQNEKTPIKSEKLIPDSNSDAVNI